MKPACHWTTAIAPHKAAAALGGPLLLALLLAAFAATSARAQMGQGGMDAVRGYIERTDELLPWARDLVNETDSGQARSVLRQAEDMNRRAGMEMDRGREGSAANMARRARAALWHAVKLAREAMGLQERLRIRAERFQDLHQQLSERARDAGNEEAVDLLQQAERQAHRAREAHLQGDMRMAWQMFESAENLTTRAARMLADAGDPERLRAELERTAGLIERARTAAGDAPAPPTARRLAEAEEALEQARRHLENGEPARARQMLGLARRLAGDTVGDDAPPPEAAQRQLERFDARMAVLRERFGDGGNDQARALLARAAEHRLRAGEALTAGDSEEALRRIRTAHDLLNQAETMMR